MMRSQEDEFDIVIVDLILDAKVSEVLINVSKLCLAYQIETFE